MFISMYLFICLYLTSYERLFNLDYSKILEGKRMSMPDTSCEN